MGINIASKWTHFALILKEETDNLSGLVYNFSDLIFRCFYYFLSLWGNDLVVKKLPLYRCRRVAVFVAECLHRLTGIPERTWGSHERRGDISTPGWILSTLALLL